MKYFLLTFLCFNVASTEYLFAMHKPKKSSPFAETKKNELTPLEEVVEPSLRFCGIMLNISINYKGKNTLTMRQIYTQTIEKPTLEPFVLDLTIQPSIKPLERVNQIIESKQNGQKHLFRLTKIQFIDPNTAKVIAEISDDVLRKPDTFFNVTVPSTSPITKSPRYPTDLPHPSKKSIKRYHVRPGSKSNPETPSVLSPMTTDDQFQSDPVLPQKNSSSETPATPTLKRLPTLPPD